jgi:hypothetical protein
MTEQILITPEKFQQLFEEETNQLEGSNLLQTPNSLLIRCILHTHGKSDLLVKLEQDLIADHPELRRRPVKPQVGTFEIYEGTWNGEQRLFCVIVYSSLLTNRKFHAEMLLGDLEDRKAIEIEAQGIIDRPGCNLANSPDKN